LNKDCIVEAPYTRSVLENLLYISGVDVYFQAHVHNYERIYPVYRNRTVTRPVDNKNFLYNPTAPVYIGNGNAGNNHGHNDAASPDPAPYSAYLTNDYGYGRFVVYNATHFYYEQFSSMTKELIDYVWIVKDNYRNF